MEWVRNDRSEASTRSETSKIWCGEGELFSGIALKTSNLYKRRRRENTRSSTHTRPSHGFSHTGLFHAAKRSFETLCSSASCGVPVLPPISLNSSRFALVAGVRVRAWRLK